jgi:trehalose-phosphatase
MKTSRGTSGIPASLWRRIAAARHRLLMLDYDGTLAPLTPQRDRALPLPDSIRWLEALAADRGTDVAVISGRPLRELERFIRLRGVRLIGEHGWELRRPDGRRMRHRLPAAARRALDGAARTAIAYGWGARLERKRSGLVLHTRGLSSPRARALARRAARVWSGPATAALRLDRIDGGLELRAREFDKGTAAGSLIAGARSGTLAVFVGDDRTDEDAFEVVQATGFGVRVGKRRRSSRALAHLADCRAVTSFLERWVRVTTA